MGNPIYGTTNQPDISAGFLTTGELIFTTSSYNNKSGYELAMKHLTGNQQFTMEDQEYYDLLYLHETKHEITGNSDHPGGHDSFNLYIWNNCIR